MGLSDRIPVPISEMEGSSLMVNARRFARMTYTDLRALISDTHPSDNLDLTRLQVDGDLRKVRELLELTLRVVSCTDTSHRALTMARSLLDEHEPASREIFGLLREREDERRAPDQS